MIKNWMNWEPSLIISMYQTTLTNVYLSLGSTSPSSSSGSLSGSSKVTLEQWSPLHSLGADWLHLNTFPHAEDALSRTRRFLNSWKTGFAVKASQRSSHLYRSKPWIQTSDPTEVVHSADWLQLKSFPHAEDALSRTRRFINTWKTGFAMKANQCSSHLHWVKPWIETSWSNYIDTQYWMTGPEHFSPVENALPRTRKLLNT